MERKIGISLGIVVTIMAVLCILQKPTKYSNITATPNPKVFAGEKWTYEWAYSTNGPWSSYWSSNVNTDPRPRVMRTVILK